MRISGNTVSTTMKSPVRYITTLDTIYRTPEALPCDVTIKPRPVYVVKGENGEPWSLYRSYLENGVAHRQFIDHLHEEGVVYVVFEGEKKGIYRYTKEYPYFISCENPVLGGGAFDPSKSTLTEGLQIEYGQESGKDIALIRGVGVATTTDIVIPEGVIVKDGVEYEVRFAQGCFVRSNITSLYLGEGVKEVPDCYGCANLARVTIPSSVESIYGAFEVCKSLTSVTIPDGVRVIGTSAFLGCTSLKSVTLGNGVTEIGMDAFTGCTSLTSVTIPDSVTHIGGYAFSGCTNLDCIFLGKNIVEIQESAFEDCPSLKIYAEADSKPEGWADDFTASYGAREGLHINDRVAKIEEKIEGSLGGDFNGGGSSTPKLYRHDIHLSAWLGSAIDLYFSFYNADGTNYSTHYEEDDEGTPIKQPDFTPFRQAICGNNDEVIISATGSYQAGDGIVNHILIRKSEQWDDRVFDINYEGCVLDDLYDTVTEVGTVSGGAGGGKKYYKHHITLSINNEEWLGDAYFVAINTDPTNITGDHEALLNILSAEDDITPANGALSGVKDAHDALMISGIYAAGTDFGFNCFKIECDGQVGHFVSDTVTVSTLECIDDVVTEM